MSRPVNKIEFLIVREGESTQAIVTLETPLDLSPDEAMQKICDCVASWINDTKEGLDAWDESGEDFNIGDLSGYDGDQMLINRFILAELFNVKVAANEVQVLDSFTYDSVLPRRSKLFVEPE